jgi:hypothetical protein
LAAVWVLGVLANSTAAYAQHGALFVSNFFAKNVSVYPRAVNGTAAPTKVITGGLVGPHEVTVYSSAAGKELILADNEANTVTFYDANISSPTFGQLTRTIAGPDTGLNFPLGLGVDSLNGDLYVTNDDHSGIAFSITVYKIANVLPGVVNDLVPDRTITGDQTKISSPAGIAIDPIFNEIYVSNYDIRNRIGGQSINVYPRAAVGNQAPSRMIQGAATTLNRPQGLVYDMLNGKLYVANSAFDQTAVAGSLLVFGRSASGNVAPSLTVQGTATLLCHPLEMAYDDQAMELSVANAGGCAEAVTVYNLKTLNATNQAPIRTLVTSAPREYNPIGIAVIPDQQQLTSNIGPVEATVAGGAPVIYSSTGYTCNFPSGSIFPVGTTQVSCNGTDIFGPTTASFWVTVVDTIAPTFINASNLEAEAFTSTEVAFDVTAIDRGVNVEVVCTPPSGTTFYVGTTTVNCVADPNHLTGGPSGSASFTVTVTRKVAPLPGGACFVVDFREITYFNGSAVITSSDANVRARNGLPAFNPALWPYRAAGGTGYTKSRGTLFRLYGFTSGEYIAGHSVPNEDQPWITYPVQWDADSNAYYVDLGGPNRARVCPTQLQDYVLSGKKGNGHKDSSALLPTVQQNVPGIMLAHNSQIVKLPTHIKREMDGLGLVHGDFGKIDFISVQQQGNGNAQFREFVNVQMSFPGDSQVDRVAHYTYGLMTAFNINFESFAGCNYVDSAPGNDGVRIVDLWSPNKSAKQGYNIWQACGTKEPTVNQIQRENYDVPFNAVQILSTVNAGTDTMNVFYGTIAPLTDADKKKKDLKLDWLDWMKFDR